MLNGHGVLARDERGQPRFTSITTPAPGLQTVKSVLARSTAYRLVRTSVERAPSVHQTLHRLGLIDAPPQADAVDRAGFGVYEVYRTPPRAELEEAWTLTERLLLETRRLAADHGAAFAVVTVPGPWEIYPDVWQDIVARVPAMRQARFDLDEPLRRLVSFLNAEGIASIDLAPAFRALAPGSPRLYYVPDYHWTPEGHRAAATAVAAAITPQLRTP
jgi:hypothetical protein